jgi:UDP-N-acetylmuramyl tripeptide synthase
VRTTSGSRSVRVADPLTVLDRVASAALRSVNAASRAAGRGQGTVAGGRVALALSPGLLGRLSSRCQVVLVSGTNGKTTTTALLAAALATRGEVATNATGSNMPEGHVAALVAARGATSAVLECDEVWLPRVVETERPAAIVLLNLSRDQLDRTAEVRHVAGAWADVLGRFAGTCVANADDPLVVHAARHAANTAWFAGGRVWSADATTCPSCLNRLELSETSWACACGLARPDVDATAVGGVVVVDGVEVPLAVQLPGAFNRANALAALLAAVRLGIDPVAAATGIGAVAEVAGRFARCRVGDHRVRLMLAKNPAGWTALLELVEHDAGPLVLAVNARVADGRDPSWLYDVAFEQLAGRRVVATGERWRDLSTRLYYAGVEHEAVRAPGLALDLAARSADGAAIDVIANYTAFAELWASARAEH